MVKRAQQQLAACVFLLGIFCLVLIHNACEFKVLPGDLALISQSSMQEASALAGTKISFPPADPVINSMTIEKVERTAISVFVDLKTKNTYRIYYQEEGALLPRSVDSSDLTELDKHYIWITNMVAGTKYKIWIEDSTGTISAKANVLFPQTSSEVRRPQAPAAADVVATMPTAKRTLFVNAADCNHASTGLQAQLNAAIPGDHIVLESGTTCIGNFIFPKKSGNSSDWIVVRTNQTLPSNRPIHLQDYSLLPKILSPPRTSSNFNRSTIWFEQGAHHYFLHGLELSTAEDGEYSTLVSSDDVNHVVISSLLLHNRNLDPARSFADMKRVKWAMSLHGTDIAIRNSWFETTYPGFSEIPGDYYGPNSYCFNSAYVTRFEFRNNECRSVGIGVFLNDDGGEVSIEDINISQNLFEWDDRFRKGSPQSNGRLYDHRGPIELKKGRRVLMEGNIIQNVWGNQIRGGYVFILTPRGGSAMQEQSKYFGIMDVKVSSNIVRNAAGFFQLNGQNKDGGWKSIINTPLSARLEISNNLVFDTDGFTRTCKGCYYEQFRNQFAYLPDGGEDYIIESNSWISPKGDGPSFLRFAGGGIGGIQVRRNIAFLPANIEAGGGVSFSGSKLLTGENAPQSYSGEALRILNSVTDRRMGSEFKDNFFVVTTEPSLGWNTAKLQPLFPTGNFWMGNDSTGIQQMGFENFDLKKFWLSSQSPYRNSVNGMSPGVDFILLKQKLPEFLRSTVPLSN